MRPHHPTLTRGAALLAAALASLSMGALAQTSPPSTPRVATDLGRTEFEANCASCHGKDGKGGGPLAELLRKSPPDLTQLARRNGGVLPMGRLYDSITGETVAAHGSRDMPVWGREYRERAANYYMELPYDPEAYTRARVLLLLEYISRLQQK